jgi:hypothetical protein
MNLQITEENTVKQLQQRVNRLYSNYYSVFEIIAQI